ncbi:MAG: phytoene/squalene synthase family protein [Candidatus Eremiobacteraeota bacterium]|nr:phytoene/squalene synthase family protein [Candidatus Eremiobacteraeota bacterium]
MRDCAKSFYFSTRVLPKAKREAVEALYGFCRFTDDLADAPGPSMHERYALFARVKRDLAALRSARFEASFPWYPALRRAFERFPIALDDALRLVEGCESDLAPVAIDSLERLEEYSSAVAGTVGRCSLPILGIADADSLRRGERLGIAMQLTNVLRDVEEDRAMGRIYLPMGEFPQTSVGEVMQAVALRARTYYREARVLAARVPNDGSRVALLLTGAVYEGLLDRLEARRYDLTRGRAYVPLPQKLRLAACSLLDAYTGLATIR